MGDAVTRAAVVLMLLQLRLWLGRRELLLQLAALLAVPGLATWLWLWPRQEALRQALAPVLVAPSTARPAAPRADASADLAAFYATLGPAGHPEQEVRTLFRLATRNELVLGQGQYESKPDPKGKVLRYQILLPLKGSYGAVWSFVQMAMLAIPCASLDELSFRRESASDESVEASLRLTLYLNVAEAGR